MTFVTRNEMDRDVDAIRNVNRLAFGGADESRLVDALRQEGDVRLSLVAEVDDQVVGHILFSELRIATPTEIIPALALAPMAVLPTYQRRGIGSELVRHGLSKCREHGHTIVIVLGHPDFYPRFGFSRELARNLESPYSCEAFMAAELIEGVLSHVVGTVHYPQPFGEM